MDLLTSYIDRAAELDRDEAWLRKAAESWPEFAKDQEAELNEWFGRIALEKAILRQQMHEAKAWATTARAMVHGYIERGEGDELVRLAQRFPQFAEMLLDAQAFRDDEWVDTEEAARVYGCTTSYMRRLARREFEPHERRKHPDGGWRYLVGAVRRKRKRS